MVEVLTQHHHRKEIIAPMYLSFHAQLSSPVYKYRIPILTKRGHFKLLHSVGRDSETCSFLEYRQSRDILLLRLLAYIPQESNSGLQGSQTKGWPGSTGPTVPKGSFLSLGCSCSADSVEEAGHGGTLE